VREGKEGGMCEKAKKVVCERREVGCERREVGCERQMSYRDFLPV